MVMLHGAPPGPRYPEGVLASGVFQHPTVDTTVSGITSVADFDASLELTFVVPLSGKVVCRIGVTSAQAGGAANTYLYVREGSTVIKQVLCQDSLLHLEVTQFVVTGLTPGAVKKWKPSISKSGGGSVNFYHGPTYGQVTFVIEAG